LLPIGFKFALIVMNRDPARRQSLLKLPLADTGHARRLTEREALAGIERKRKLELELLGAHPCGGQGFVFEDQLHDCLSEEGLVGARGRWAVYTPMRAATVDMECVAWANLDSDLNPAGFILAAGDALDTATGLWGAKISSLAATGANGTALRTPRARPGVERALTAHCDAAETGPMG